MPSKLLSLLAVVCALGGCFLERTPRQKFVDLLREFQASRPKGKTPELSPEQLRLRDRLVELKKKDALAFQRAAQAMEGLESYDWSVRHAAWLAIADCGETGSELLRFRAGFFDPDAPADFDALLLKSDDSAVFHLRKNLIEKVGEERARAKRALDLLLPLKTKLLLEWLAATGERLPGPTFLEILAARNRALPALGDAVESRNPYLGSVAIKAASDIGTPEAAAFLARLAAPGTAPGVKPEDVWDALARMDPDVSVPAVADLVAEGAFPDPLEAAWFIAERAAPAFEERLKALSSSEDPEVRAAGLCGRLRLVGDKAAPAIRELALAEGAVVGPLRVALFLKAFPHLARPFEADIARLAKASDKGLRVVAAALLGFVPGQDSQKALLAALDDPEIEVRLAALDAAGRRLRAGPLEPLFEAVRRRARDGEGSVRRRALAVLGSTRAPAAIPDLVAAIESSDPADKVAGLDALSLYRDPALLARLPLEVYWGRDAEARLALVRGLVMASDPSAGLAIRALLRSRVSPSRLAALSLLDEETARKLKKDVLQVLSSTDPVLREAGLRAICTVDPSVLFDDPDRHLKSEAGEVRLTAIRILGRSAEFAPRLISLSLSIEPEVRLAAFQAMAESLPAESRARFEASVFEGSAELRRLGVRALARVGNADSAPFLEYASRDPDRRVRAASATALAAVRGGEAAEILSRLQDDPDLSTAAASAAALEKIGAPNVAPALRESLREEGCGLSPRERGVLLETLRDFEGASEAFAEGALLADVPFEPWLDAARAWARAGREDRALEFLAKARDAGYDAFADLGGEEGFRLLFGIEGFARRLRDLFRPPRRGAGFLDRFHGRVKVYLQNGRFLKGDLLAFQNERFVLRLPSGEMELPRLQVERLEFLEEE